MKLEKPIKEKDGSILEEICPNKHGVYLIYRIPKVKRGIRGKNRSQVDELIILGLPWSKANKYLKKYNIYIERN